LVCKAAPGRLMALSARGGGKSPGALSGTGSEG